jgi:hypothetical protein
MTTKEAAIAAAGACLAEAEILLHSGTVEEAARRAYRGSGPSIPELEDMIRAVREEAGTAQPLDTPTEALSDPQNMI